MPKKSNAFKRFASGTGFKLLIILIILIIIAVLISSDVLHGGSPFGKGFFSTVNLRSLFYQMVVPLFMMCGLGMLLIGGNIDLSVAAQATLFNAFFAVMCRDTSLPWWVIFIMALVIAAIVGLLHAFMVLRLHFPAFIATIGMSSVYTGIAGWLLNLTNVNVNNAAFLSIAKTTVFKLIPLTFLLGVVLVFICQFILSKTTFGRNCFAAGGNAFASRLAGINTGRTTTILFVLCSVFTCLGGLFYVSQTKKADPTALTGSAPNMTALSAVMLGGVAFSGGTGGMTGPLIALLVMRVLDNVLTILSVKTYWNTFAVGALLIVALIMDYLQAEKRRKALLAAVQ
ncbi:MAG: ABC transporter permease [Oscillospiraceae bacterium]|nr:ABC transporter permease [Oscillospiraceae bacterium]